MTERTQAFSRSEVATLSAVLDLDALLRLCELERPDEPGLVARTLRRYGRSAQRWQRLLQMALAQGDIDPLCDVLHTFRSAAAIIGATDLSRLCATTESRARAGDTRGLDVAVEAIVEENVRILEVLGRYLAE